MLRNKVNFVSGWLLSFGLLAFTVWLDPLGVYSTWDDGGNGLTGENLGFVAVIFATSAWGFSQFARPHVQLRPEHVVLCNTLRDVCIPRDAIEAVDASGRYVRIAVGGKQYEAAGLELSNLSHWTGGHFGSQSVEAMREQALPTTEQAVVIRWRGPEVPELVLLLLWATYVAVGVAVA